MWVVPGTRDICSILILTTGGGSASCSRVPTEQQVRSARGGPGAVEVGPWSWRPFRRLVFYLLPDGTTDVRLRRGATLVRRLALVDNAILVRPRTATSIAWRAPNGNQTISTFS